MGSKWKLLILRDLLNGTKRYNELRRSLPEISQKVLTSTLKSMVSDGIVVRTAYPEVPPRVEYSLSSLGESMKPVIASMEQWGYHYKETLNK
ncbi:winged helix-turn-helix transcriptional regulator [Allocoprobacillus halotolerans]|uniref:winged helix-turn-helix transcriptional regulator n=1 Tax=Allocoprobacillus halotolerans TaxID=2944914 RepID=UPI003F49B2CE